MTKTWCPLQVEQQTPVHVERARPQGGTRRIKLDRPVGPASNKTDAIMTAETIKGS